MCPWARKFILCLVLVQPTARKHPNMAEIMLITHTQQNMVTFLVTISHLMLSNGYRAIDSYNFHSLLLDNKLSCDTQKWKLL